MLSNIPLLYPTVGVVILRTKNASVSRTHSVDGSKAEVSLLDYAPLYIVVYIPARPPLALLKLGAGNT